jgi:hypothetical protein
MTKNKALWEFSMHGHSQASILCSFVVHNWAVANDSILPIEITNIGRSLKICVLGFIAGQHSWCNQAANAGQYYSV